MNNAIILPQRTIYFSLAMQLYMNGTIKAPMLKAVDTLFDAKVSKFTKLKAAKVLWDVFEAMKGLPEPTKENTWHPNSHNLIDLRDHFLGKCHMAQERVGLVRRIINFIIILIDFDPPWRYIFDELREEAMKMEWKPKGWNDTWTKSYEAWWHE